MQLTGKKLLYKLLFTPEQHAFFKYWQISSYVSFQRSNPDLLPTTQHSFTGLDLHYFVIPVKKTKIILPLKNQRLVWWTKNYFNILYNLYLGQHVMLWFSESHKFLFLSYRLSSSFIIKHNIIVVVMLYPYFLADQTHPNSNKQNKTNVMYFSFYFIFNKPQYLTRLEFQHSKHFTGPNR